MSTVRLLRVVVAAPQDVHRERKTLDGIVDEINVTVARERNVRLELAPWETPSTGGFIQSKVSAIRPPSRIEDSDLFIGIFWKRLGPLGREEGAIMVGQLCDALHSCTQTGSPQIMVYLNQRSPELQTEEEVRHFYQLQLLPEQLPNDGHCWRYQGLSSFTTLVLRNLTRFVLELDDPGERFPVNNLPLQQNALFTGRVQELSLIRRKFGRKSSTGRIVVVSGLGGNGKTQIALELAYRSLSKYKYVFWVRAESEDSLRTDFARIAELLKLQRAGIKDVDLLAQAAKQWLHQNGDWLVIFDNADQPEFLLEYLIRREKGHVLVTSRAQNFDPINVTEIIFLNEFSVAEGVEFLLNRTKRKPQAPEIAAAKTLVGELGGLPLALEQAAACIVDLQCSIVDYLKSFKVERLKLLERFGPICGGYTASVGTTWRLNFESISQFSPAAADLLCASAFWNPDFVPIDLCTRGARVLGESICAAIQGSPLAVYELLKALSRYSLIRFDQLRSGFRIHRLVQEMVKAIGMGDLERKLWARRAIDATIAAFPLESVSSGETLVHTRFMLAVLASLDSPYIDLELALNLILGPVLISTRGYASSEVGDCYARLLIVASATEDAQIKFQILWGAWAHYYVRGDLKRAFALCAELERNADREPSGQQRDDFFLEAGRAIGSTQFSAGDIPAARIAFERALQHPCRESQTQHASRYAADPVIVCKSYLLLCTVLQALNSEAPSGITEIEALANQHPHDFSHIYGYYWIASAHQLLGQAALALKVSECAVVFCRDRGFSQWGAMAQVIRGWSLFVLGNHSKGIHEMEQGIARHEQTGARTLRPYFLTLLGEAFVGMHDFNRAREVLDTALQVSSETGEQTWASETYRQRAFASRGVNDPNAVLFWEKAREQAKLIPLFELRLNGDIFEVPSKEI